MSFQDSATTTPKESGSGVSAGAAAAGASLSPPDGAAAGSWAAGAQAGEMLGAVLRACSQEPVVVLDTGGAVENAGADKTADRIQIANTLGALLKRLLDDGLESTVLIMGGGPDAPAGCNGDHASVRSRAGRGAVAVHLWRTAMEPCFQIRWVWSKDTVL